MHVFVGGLHRSGTTILADALAKHHKLQAISKANLPQALENEGQHLQTVMHVDDALGGPGYFAHNPNAHLTEAHASPQRARLLDAQWSPLYAQKLSDAHRLEKSPSNMLRTRYLQALFPEAYFVIIVRHPLATAYATAAWAGKHGGGADAVEPTAVADFAEHWLAAHELLAADLPHVRRVRIVHLEEFCERPQEVLDRITADLGLAPTPLPAGVVQRAVNAKYERAFRNESEDVLARLRPLEAALARYGYCAADFGTCSVAGPEPRRLLASNGPVAVLANGRSEAVNGHAPSNGDASSNGHAPVLPTNFTPRRPLLLSLGTRGDVQPFFPLIHAMKKAGMSPLLATLRPYRKLAESYDVPFAALFDDDDEALRPVDEPSEEAFHAGAADFYDRRGDELVEAIGALVRRHEADVVVVGSLVFCLKWLRTLKLPLVHLRFAPYGTASSAVGGTGGSGTVANNDNGVGASLRARTVIDAVSAHAHDVAHWLHVQRSYGFSQACAVEAAIPDDDLVTAMMDLKRELTLLAYSPTCDTTEDIATRPARLLPGLPFVHTGFFGGGSGVAEPQPSVELAEYLAAGAPPICLNFGSMQVYSKAGWATDLLGALRDSGCRVLSIGAHVPSDVRSWPGALWVPSAPHGYVFSRCACVVHHGGAGTSAAAARAGAPAIVVPFLPWSDQPKFGAWLMAHGAAVHLPPSHRSRADFDAAVRAAVLEPQALQAGAKKLSALLAAERGADAAVEAMQEHFGGKRGADGGSSSLALLESLKALPGSESSKIRSGLYNMLRDENAPPVHTYALRDAWLEALSGQLVTKPLYKPDWPVRHRPIDLARHDLPHSSSLVEWWYFHAHLTAADGTAFCVFVALFRMSIDGRHLCHAHASLLVPGQKTHSYYSIAEPDAAAVVMQYGHPKKDDYFERALAEVVAKNGLPAPDRVAPACFCVPEDRMDFACHHLIIRKQAGGGYACAFEPKGEVATSNPVRKTCFSFDLTFVPTKGAVRNGLNGVSPGIPRAEDAMYYYSITRMAVSGTLRTSEAEPPLAVTGDGWYDHQFGGDASRGLGTSASLKPVDVQWVWTGVQLDDGTEVTYARTADSKGVGTAVDKAMIVDEAGRTALVDAKLSERSHWTSLQTFIRYGTKWAFSIAELELELELEAVVEPQELISLISTPAYWEGQVLVRGTRRGVPITGRGFVEQYYGSRNTSFRTMLGAVSDVVLRNVSEVLPYDPTPEHIVELSVSREFAHMVHGLPPQIFVDQIVKPVRAITDRAGKGWRSMGLLLASSVVGGEPAELERYTSFPEFLHTGSLIIDDIQDNSDLRRGGPTAHLMYGVPAAINAGTASYFLGEGLTRDMNLTTEQRLRVYELYFTCLRGAHVGQAIDINGLGDMMPSCLDSGDFSPMWEALCCCHRLKSGLPASICARTGAVMGGADKSQEAALGDYFLSLGLAFQIIDDVINLKGFGFSLKTTAEDLREGKITAPVIRALMRLADQPERQRWLWDQYQVCADERDIGGMVELIRGTGAFESCVDEALATVEDAWKLVDKTVPDSFSKMSLRAFGWFVCKVRDY